MLISLMSASLVTISTQNATKFYAQTLVLSYKTLKPEIRQETVAKIEIP